ncbi:MAG: RelA/SpoT domain-containing protein [Acidobacteriota bacterium]|nr:RelA/SpoT domain-containing protein [Acidobacteriota bacterium]
MTGLEWADLQLIYEKHIRRIAKLQFTANYNYEDRITDVIGVRVLHLFKEEWAGIHDYITEIWELKEMPIAYVRKGDRDELINLFKDKGCLVKNHQYGYRSVHYLVKSQPSKELHVTEVQVRTIFEEGWSEIDHRVRYPYHRDDPALLAQSRILNGLAGSADDMGTELRKLLEGQH